MYVLQLVFGQIWIARNRSLRRFVALLLALLLLRRTPIALRGLLIVEIGDKGLAHARGPVRKPLLTAQLTARERLLWTFGFQHLLLGLLRLLRLLRLRNCRF